MGQSDNFRAWTRDEWREFHRLARARRFIANVPASLYLMLDERGLGVTLRHDKGHLIPPAAMANVLGHAARSRRIRSDHMTYIIRCRALRHRGTWL